MTPEEIAFAEAAIALYADHEDHKDCLRPHEVALLNAARYGVKVANNCRNRGPRLIPRVWRWSE